MVWLWWAPSFHIPKPSDPSSPRPGTNCTRSSSSSAFPKLCFAFGEMGTDVLWKGRVWGELPIKWPKVLLGWRRSHRGEPLEPPFPTIRYNHGKEREAGREWGFQTSPSAHRGHVPSTSPRALPDRQPDIHPCSLLQPQLPTPPERPNAWIFPLGGGHRSSWSLVLIQGS